MIVVWFMCVLGCKTVEHSEKRDEVTESGDSVSVVDDSGNNDVHDESGVEEERDYRSAKWCAECHPSQYAEWEQSMHRYAAHSPVFDRMTAKAIRDTAGATGTFCTGCHTPLGTMDGEPGTTTAAERSEISLEGVTCVVCHQSVAHEEPIGNTSLTIDLNAPIQGVFGDSNSTGHQSVKSDLLTSPELCGSCHDVFNFPGLRIEEAYTEYTESPAAEAGLTCQDCHMSQVPGAPSEKPLGHAAVVEGLDTPERKLSSHRFIGPDYSMLDTFPYPDDPAATSAAQADMRQQTEILLKNSVRIGDVSVTENDAGSTLNVTVESLTSGHRVPTGFTSERQLWLAVDVVEDGEIVWRSGDLDANGDLRDELSWEVIAGTAAHDDQLVNFQSKNLVRSDINLIDDEVAEVFEVVFPFDATYIYRNSLKPLEARQLSYSLPTLSPNAEIRIRLRYRNLPPYVLRALLLDELVEKLQIVDIDETVLGGTE